MKLALDYLPRTARDLVELIGIRATLDLVKHYGGRQMQIAKGKRAKGAVQHQELAERIGAVAVRKLSERYGADVLTVPLCTRALLAARDAELQARFDELTGGGRSARAAVAIIVGEARIHETTVWRALKRDTGDAAIAKAAATSNQLDMFA